MPVNTPVLGEREKELLLECVESGWISSEGPFVAEFEAATAGCVQRKHGVAVSNGTAALDIAVAALRLGPGDEVIVPSHTIISCVSAIVRSGATPVLVDSDRETWNMCPEQVASKITARTKAIMVVHLYGLPVDMDAIELLAEEFGLMVIEDAAEMLGQFYRDKPCGSFGAISTFSFYPNKHVTTGEGGMCVTDDDELAERCRSLRNLCFEPERRFMHRELGWNYRMTNLQAAVGLAQLEKLDRTVVRKREIGTLYSQLLSDLENVQLPLATTEYARNIYWVFGLVLTGGDIDGASILRRLHDAGIGGRPFFYPMHQQPVFQAMNLFGTDKYPAAEYLANFGLYLPSGVGITDEQIVHVARVVSGVLA